ncbi:hypothetical protein F8S13_19540 [Chloroflexia bacterium SDU3-3]|nr:hypothetical protein F8S13_19540 [Chloroflexia bacterium SDU3-3]
MSIVFLDLEWGQIYGTAGREFFPTEIGMVIAHGEAGAPTFVSRKIALDIDLVIRRNRVDGAGKTIGYSESVVNLARDEHQKPFDSRFRLGKQDRQRIHTLYRAALDELRGAVNAVVAAERVQHTILFGGRNDIKLLNQARVDTIRLNISDLQRILQREVGYVFSLDKISGVLGFRSNGAQFGTANFRYAVPREHRHIIKPHRALGDACRIFAIFQEYRRAHPYVIEQCQRYLAQQASAAEAKA